MAAAPIDVAPASSRLLPPDEPTPRILTGLLLVEGEAEQRSLLTLDAGDLVIRGSDGIPARWTIHRGDIEAETRGGTLTVGEASLVIGATAATIEPDFFLEDGADVSLLGGGAGKVARFTGDGFYEGGVRLGADSAGGARMAWGSPSGPRRHQIVGPSPLSPSEVVVGDGLTHSLEHGVLVELPSGTLTVERGASLRIDDATVAGAPGVTCLGTLDWRRGTIRTDVVAGEPDGPA